MQRTVTALSVIVNAAALVLLSSFWTGWPVSPPGEAMAQDARAAVDAVDLVGQVGRFDLVSMLLTLFGVAAIIGGIFAFGFVRGESYAVARKTAEDIAERRLTELLQELRKQISEVQGYGATREAPSSQPTIGALEKAGDETETEEFGKESC